mmetsp:Transcript_8987/g.25674  ORF Transcript_8987/g.25674 Transcript_8987/m.25674 type:complete len:329 (-) Transcript_8987:483-1469(-)
MSKSSGGRCKKQSVFDFIQNTYHMVEVTDKSILDWSADGKCFVIKDHARFVEELPKHFRHGNFRSFVRQLNFYEFRKLKADEISSRGNQKLAHYYHPSFQRGKPQLLKDIRQKRKDSEDGESVAVAELRDQVTVLKDRVLGLQQQMGMFMEWMVAVHQQLPALAAPGAAPTSGSHTDQGLSPAILSTAIPTVPGIDEPPVPPALGRRPSSSGSSVSSASGRKRRRNANDDAMLEAVELLRHSSGGAQWPNGGEAIAAIPRALSRTRSSTAAATAAGGGGFEPISRASSLEIIQSILRRHGSSYVSRSPCAIATPQAPLLCALHVPVPV